MKVHLEAPHFDLDLTLKPSFVSCVYRKLGPREWIKIAGKLKGLKLKQEGSTLVAEVSRGSRAKLQELASLHSGLWHEPFEKNLLQLPRGLRRVAQALSRAYPGVRLPLAAGEEVRVFVAIALSRRTSYSSLVLRWCETIWENFPNPLELAQVEARELEKIVGSSYQVKQLKDSIAGLLRARGIARELFPELKQLPAKPFGVLKALKPEQARLVLLNSSKWIGPKTSDSYLLTTGALDVPPCDAHLTLLVRRLKLAPGAKPPRAELCKRFVCLKTKAKELGLEPCPQASECLRALLSKKLGKLAGWFQTLAYLHGVRRCRRISPRCKGCELQELCPYPLQSPRAKPTKKVTEE